MLLIRVNHKKRSLVLNKGASCIILGSALIVLGAAVATAQNTPTQLPLKSAKGNINFAGAHPEQITNENFPNKIKSFDYPNADILEVVKAISKLTGKNFILGSGVGGKITILAPSEITVAEAYRAFLSALAMNGLTIVPSGKFLKIRKIQEAKDDSIETYSGAYFPDTDQVITRIMQLKHISAEEVGKELGKLLGAGSGGEMTPYTPTNSLIITGLGSSVERISRILEEMDVPGFEEKIVVLPIRHADASDIAILVTQLTGADEGRLYGGVPRYRSSRSRRQESSGGGAVSISKVLPDLRTNAIVVVANKAGVDRVKELVKTLDYKLSPEDAGGVYVYYLRHSKAKGVADVLNGLAKESSKTAKSTTSARSVFRGGSGSSSTGASRAAAGVFDGSVNVVADEPNNSLIITASKQDYEVVQDLIKKMDLPRDQVFVKTIIMEMSAERGLDWGINYYNFMDNTKGIGRQGFSGGSLQDAMNPAADRGAVIGFGAGKTVSVSIGGASFEVPSLTGLVKLLKTNVGGNVLSTPQITALNNEKAVIEVGENTPVAKKQTFSATGAQLGQSSFEFKDILMKLELTPFISPDTDTVRMDIKQKVDSPIAVEIGGESAVKVVKRDIETKIVVDSGDTAVLGGLMTDNESTEVSKVPLLGDIPILGWLFKSTKTSKEKKNLIVFITPRIIRNSTDAAMLLKDKLDSRAVFIRKHMRGRDPHGEAMDNLPRRKEGAGTLGEGTEGDFFPEEDTTTKIEQEVEELERLEQEEPLPEEPEELLDTQDTPYDDTESFDTLGI